MRLISAELTNFCQHRYLGVTFAPGLTAIIGRNGSGKSNLLKAIYATITGDFGRNDGLKTDNICSYAAATAPSRVQVNLEHGGSSLSITRSLRPTSTRLCITAPDTKETIITKAQEATESITGTLGVATKILADYVFVDQWTIFDFLAMMPAERAKAFQRLFRTERAEIIWKMLGTYIDSFKLPTPGINKDAINKILVETRAEHEDLSKRLVEANDKAKSYDASNLKSRIADYQRRKAAESKTQTLTEKLETLKRDIHKSGDDIGELRGTTNELDTYITAERESYFAARQSLGNWNTLEAIEQTRQNLLLKKKTHVDSLSMGPSLPNKPFPYIGDEYDTAFSEWYKTFSDITHEKHRLTKLVTAIKNGITVCDNCGGYLGEAASHLHEHEKKLADLIVKYTSMDFGRKLSHNYDVQMGTYANWHNAYDQRGIELDEQLANLAAVQKPDKPKEELLAVVKQYEEITHTHKLLMSDLNDLQRQYQGKVSVYEQLLKDRTEVEADLLLLTVNQVDADLAAKQLEEYEVLCVERKSLTAIIENHARIIQQHEVTLQQLIKQEKEVAVTKEWLKHCEEMRTILHRDNLPRLVAHNFLELMQDEINSLLIRFGSNFSVQADESLSFNVTFHDGHKVPAARLSGGEKVLLALAFRVVVNDIFAKDLGLLVLDEPTAGLDEGNLTCLRIAIERLKELSAARGLQVIIITHERDLNNLFDHVIEMGKDNDSAIHGT